MCATFTPMALSRPCATSRPRRLSAASRNRGGREQRSSCHSSVVNSRSRSVCWRLCSSSVDDQLAGSDVTIWRWSLRSVFRAIGRPRLLLASGNRRTRWTTETPPELSFYDAPRRLRKLRVRTSCWCWKGPFAASRGRLAGRTRKSCWGLTRRPPFLLPSHPQSIPPANPLTLSLVGPASGRGALVLPSRRRLACLGPRGGRVC